MGNIKDEFCKYFEKVTTITLQILPQSYEKILNDLTDFISSQLYHRPLKCHTSY